MVNRIKIHLDKKFITKALDRDTFMKVLASEHPSVLHRLYLIANEVKEQQYFMELNHDVYACSARVKTKYVYAGEARSQASVVSFMKDRIGHRPHYTVLFKIYEKVGMKEVFNFTHTTTSEKDLISVINKLEIKAQELCQNKVGTY